jgi:hypothetical protein
MEIKADKWVNNMTQFLDSNGEIFKNGICYNVPESSYGPTHYPLPSECDRWIKLFNNLKDNFTDEEIMAINKRNEDELYGKM